MQKMIRSFILAGSLFSLLISFQACTDNGNGEITSSQKKEIEKFQTEGTSEAVTVTDGGTNEPSNFITAAKAVIPAVVHIKTTVVSEAPRGIFGRMQGGSAYGIASGSGVIISADGYIATNNHVVEGGKSIEVILPNRESYKAELIGTDPNTDLALLKVDIKDAPFLKFGNSDDAQIGEWVLAAGYPLSLNSTVTSGIISAKGRSIGIINRPEPNRFGGPPSATGNAAVESFIQTDAAINPGNSGGALVNTRGELIGINTAMASETGSYAGYAFAVPVNLAKKVLEDLKTFGTVKRAILGVSFPSPSLEDQYFKQQGIDPGKINGVYIIGVQKGSAAADAGLKEGDIIQSVNGNKLHSSSEFSERIARHRPGDKILITYLRNKEPKTVSVVLQGADSETGNDQATLSKIYEKLGATFKSLPEVVKQKLDIHSGVIVEEVQQGGFFDRIGILRGTIIVNINGRPINDPDDIDKALLSSQTGMIKIMAIAPDGSRLVFTFSLGT